MRAHLVRSLMRRSRRSQPSSLLASFNHSRYFALDRRTAALAPRFLATTATSDEPPSRIGPSSGRREEDEGEFMEMMHKLLKESADTVSGRTESLRERLARLFRDTRGGESPGATVSGDPPSGSAATAQLLRLVNGNDDARWLTKLVETGLLDSLAESLKGVSDPNEALDRLVVLSRLMQDPERSRPSSAGLCAAARSVADVLERFPGLPAEPVVSVVSSATTGLILSEAEDSDLKKNNEFLLPHFRFLVDYLRDRYRPGDAPEEAGYHRPVDAAAGALALAVMTGHTNADKVVVETKGFEEVLAELILTDDVFERRVKFFQIYEPCLVAPGGDALRQRAVVRGAHDLLWALPPEHPEVEAYLTKLVGPLVRLLDSRSPLLQLEDLLRERAGKTDARPTRFLRHPNVRVRSLGVRLATALTSCPCDEGLVPRLAQEWDLLPELCRVLLFDVISKSETDPDRLLNAELKRAAVEGILHVLARTALSEEHVKLVVAVMEEMQREKREIGPSFCHRVLIYSLAWNSSGDLRVAARRVLRAMGEPREAAIRSEEAAREAWLEYASRRTPSLIWMLRSEDEEVQNFALEILNAERKPGEVWPFDDLLETELERVATTHRNPMMHRLAQELKRKLGPRGEAPGGGRDGAVLFP